MSRFLGLKRISESPTFSMKLVEDNDLRTNKIYSNAKCEKKGLRKCEF